MKLPLIGFGTPNGDVRLSAEHWTPGPHRETEHVGSEINGPREFTSRCVGWNVEFFTIYLALLNKDQVDCRLLFAGRGVCSWRGAQGKV
jgi:hypothetical protein